MMALAGYPASKKNETVPGTSTDDPGPVGPRQYESGDWTHSVVDDASAGAPSPRESNDPGRLTTRVDVHV
jgi:hypothetical protein